jgi:hypothetical protein
MRSAHTVRDVRKGSSPQHDTWETASPAYPLCVSNLAAGKVGATASPRHLLRAPALQYCGSGHDVIAGLVTCWSLQHQCTTMSKSNQYVGLDVSLKETSFCVIDDADKIVWRGRVDSTAGSCSNGREAACAHAVRIELESVQLSSWPFHELKGAGLPVICVHARHAKAALSLKVNKTDANDALGLAQIMRVGWYREMTVKSGRKRACGAVGQKTGPSKKGRKYFTGPRKPELRSTAWWRCQDSNLRTSNDLLNVRWIVALGYCVWLMGYEIGPGAMNLPQDPSPRTPGQRCRNRTVTT